MNRPFAILFALSIVTASIMPCLSRVSAESNNVNLIYQGEGKPLNDEWPPAIALKLTDGTYIYFYSNKNLSLQDNEPLNLSLTAVAGPSPNGRAIGLFDVSYNASWLQYPIVIYHWNGNPADFNVWYHNGPQYSLDYNLTLNNIPKGNQQIEFKVISIGMYIGIPYFSSFKKEETMTLNLSIGNSPTNPTTSPTVTTNTQGNNQNLILFAVLIAILLTALAFLLYFRKKKRAEPA